MSDKRRVISNGPIQFQKTIPFTKPVTPREKSLTQETQRDLSALKQEATFKRHRLLLKDKPISIQKIHEAVIPREPSSTRADQSRRHLQFDHARTQSGASEKQPIKVVTKKLISLQKPLAAARKPVQLGYRRQIPDEKINFYIQEPQPVLEERKPRVHQAGTRRPLVIRRNNFVSEERPLARTIKISNFKLESVVQEDQYNSARDPIIQDIAEPEHFAKSKPLTQSETQLETAEKRLGARGQLQRKPDEMTKKVVESPAVELEEKLFSSCERTNCNSSVNVNNRAHGTVFSFKSQMVSQEPPSFPMSPLEVIRHFSKQLSEFERTEILEYPDVYFIGQGAKKILGSPHLEFNFGYDDEQGDYKFVEGDQIGYRYEIIKFLGKGSFGVCLKCIDHKTHTEIALKVVKNKQKYVYQAGVELKILQFLKQNDPENIMNVVHIEDYVIFRKHLCLGFELLSMNLYEFLKVNNFNGFDASLIRRFAIQLLYALKYLKMFQIIHCDLKPENIMLKEDNKSGIKVIDFGSSTFQDERMYTYIQSRFYRAPEIMLGVPYDCAIDMWSFGCICAELFIGYPIFPGESEQDQMCRIIEMIGLPQSDLLQISERKQKFFKQPGEPIMFKNSRGKLRRVGGKPLQAVIGTDDPDFLDFVQKCLIMDPRKRMTPNQALKHVWVLKGLPPQVLIHHQKMHGIATPDLPATVLHQRTKYLEENKKPKFIKSERSKPSKSLN